MKIVTGNFFVLFCGLLTFFCCCCPLSFRNNTTELHELLLWARVVEEQKWNKMRGKSSLGSIAKWCSSCYFDTCLTFYRWPLFRSITHTPFTNQSEIKLLKSSWKQKHSETSEREKTRFNYRQIKFDLFFIPARSSIYNIFCVIIPEINVKPFHFW